MFGESKELFLKGIDFVFTEAIFRTCGEYEVCTCAHIHTCRTIISHQHVYQL